MTHKQLSALLSFMEDFPNAAIRGRIMARQHKRTEIRSTKHNHMAIVWDELGNAFVLTSTCCRMQLIGNETKGL